MTSKFVPLEGAVLHPQYSLRSKGACRVVESEVKALRGMDLVYDSR